jgi:hypothetical protein
MAPLPALEMMSHIFRSLFQLIFLLLFCDRREKTRAVESQLAEESSVVALQERRLRQEEARPSGALDTGSLQPQERVRISRPQNEPLGFLA